MHIEVRQHAIAFYTQPLAKLEPLFQRQHGAYIITTLRGWGASPLPDLRATIRTGQYINENLYASLILKGNVHLNHALAFDQCALIFQEIQYRYFYNRNESDRKFGNLYGRAIDAYQRNVCQPFNATDQFLWDISDWKIAT